MIKTESFLEYRITYSCQLTGMTGVCFCKWYEKLNEAIDIFKIPSEFRLEGFDGLNWKLINNSMPIFV